MRVCVYQVPICAMKNTHTYTHVYTHVYHRKPNAHADTRAHARARARARTHTHKLSIIPQFLFYSSCIFVLCFRRHTVRRATLGLLARSLATNSPMALTLRFHPLFLSCTVLFLAYSMFLSLAYGILVSSLILHMVSSYTYLIFLYLCRICLCL